MESVRGARVERLRKSKNKGKLQTIPSNMYPVKARFCLRRPDSNDACTIQTTTKTKNANVAYHNKNIQNGLIIFDTGKVFFKTLDSLTIRTIGLRLGCILDLR